MKINIKKGQDINEAVESFKKFLEKNTAGYNILESDMNIYLTLQSEDGDVCPLNDRNFIMIDKEIMDVDSRIRTVVRRELTSNGLKYIDNQIKEIQKLPKLVEKAEKQYIDSVEKKRKSETIKKNKEELEVLEYRLSKMDENIAYWEKVREVLENKNGDITNCLCSVRYENDDDNEAMYYLKLDTKHVLLRHNLCLGEEFIYCAANDEDEWPDHEDCRAPIYGYDFKNNRVYLRTAYNKIYFD